MALSEGGMGRVELTVLKGRKFQRLYAVKRLQPAVQADPSAREMFLEEARLAGLVHHPNVVGVLDVGEDEGGPFLAMEYVEGITARDLISRAHQSGAPIPVEVCCEVAAQAAHGLAKAHNLSSHDGVPLQIVHRDVSPHNLLIGFDGVVRVADFGIARAIGRDYRTSTGVLKGKLGYMAPETLRFHPADRRSDLFALGIVLYEMLAARRLYGGKNDLERAQRIMNEPPPDIGEIRTDVPPDVQSLLVALLSKDPDDRPSEAGQVAERLDQSVRELQADGGSESIAEFVRAGFEDERTSRQEDIQRALASLEQEPVAASPSVTAAVRVRPRPRNRRGMLVLGSVFLLLGIAIMVPLALSGEPEAVEAAEPTADTPLVEPSTVSVELRTTPPGALVTGANFDDVVTPATLDLPRGDRPVAISFELDGHVSRREDIVPDGNQRLEFVLTRAPSATLDEPQPNMRRVPRTPSGQRPQMQSGTNPSLDDLWE